MTRGNGYVTYKDLKAMDLTVHFAERYRIARDVIQVLLKLCGAHGYTEVVEIATILSEGKLKVDYRKVVYMHKVWRFHHDLMDVLKRGAMIGERGMTERMKGAYDDLIEYVNGECRVRGTYRDLVLRRG